MNFYGEADCQRVLKSIKAICVSHMHFDHQSGIFCLLKARHRAFAESGQSPSPCAFIGPRGFNRWLEFFSQHSGEDGMSDVAEAKDLQTGWSRSTSQRHSTVGQALSTGGPRVRAGLTILKRHFKTRYTGSVPVLKLI
uniref:ribonuclease Z n=1 Tax=Macrostomum lignano TaxID=282301 RepID=A0A1I8FFG2_9PLAT